jgi:hypothetical protein
MHIDATFHCALARHGGDSVLLPLPAARTIVEYGSIVGGCGVYITCDDFNRVMYVGSVHRPGNRDGISSRIGEHLRDARKALRWARLWILVVDEQKTVEWIRTYEAIVGEELQPTWNERLPMLSGETQ